MNSTRKNEILVNGRHVGDVIGSCFQKSIEGSRHMLRKPPAIAYGVDALNDAERAGADCLEVKDRETGIVYSSTLDNFRQHCFEVNRGYEPQVAMRLENWTKTGGKEADKAEPVKQPKKKRISAEEARYRDLVDNTPLMQLHFDIFRSQRR